MAIPCVIALILFSYLPLFGWLIAFFDYKPGLVLFQTKFVGLKWFTFAFKDMEMLLILRNTLVLSFLSLLAYPLAIGFAMFLMEMRSARIRKLVQTLTTLPNFISWVLVFSIAYAFLSSGDGVLNKILLNFNLIETPLNPLANPEIVWPLQTAILIWKTLGFSAIIYIAAIVGIDQGLYEAASIDGAGRFQKMWHITIPGIIPTFITLLLLGIGNLLNTGFEQYYLFKNPLTQSTIEVLDLYVYRIGITLNNFPLSTAIGMSKTLVSVLLLFGANYLSKKLRDQSIF
jgi:putative aldouronate transport system permease protein